MTDAKPDSAKVIPFPVAAEPRDPHTAGAMKCERCGHCEPAVVAPVGRKYFECPKCHVMAMKRDELVLPADGVPRRSCPNCKGQAFAVMVDGILCVGCGTRLIHVPPEGWPGDAG